MTLKSALTVKPGMLALMILMAATRFHHFGSAFVLPDASLAVFFLAAYWRFNRVWFVTLLLEAGIIDYLAISQYGVSDFCISSAYAFLIPAYAAMWMGGEACDKFKQLSFANVAKQTLLLSLGASASFLISNLSFYLLSDHVPGGGAEFFSEVIGYYPSYLGSTFLYVLPVAVSVYLVKTMLLEKANHKAV